MAHMRRVRSIMCILVAVTLVITPFGAAPAASGDDGRYIVIFADGISPSLPPTLTLLGVKVIHVLWLINALAIQIPLGIIGDTVQQLLNNPDVLGVFPDLVTSVGQITSTPAPTGEKYGWNMQRSNVDDVHNSSPELRGNGVTVAVLDTGIDPDHSELSPRVVGGYNALPQGGSYKDDKGHGTHIAGIIAAAGKKITGVAPQVSLVAVKVLDQNGVGRNSDLIKGLQWVFGSGIRVVNMSLQFSDNGSSQENMPLERATWRLYNEKGVIMVAAAGNHGCYQDPDEGGGDGGDGGGMVCDGSTNVLYPARFPWIIAVTAIDYYNRVPDYCRYGPEMDTVDIAAGGGSKETNIEILSTNKGGGYGWGSGTSQAAPHVSGAVALALQQQPQLDFAGVLNVLEAAGRDLQEPQNKQGEGLIDVERIVKALQ